MGDKQIISRTYLELFGVHCKPHPDPFWSGEGSLISVFRLLMDGLWRRSRRTRPKSDEQPNRAGRRIRSRKLRIGASKRAQTEFVHCRFAPDRGLTGSEFRRLKDSAWLTPQPEHTDR